MTALPSDTPNAPDSLFSTTALHNDAHFLRAVSDMAQTHEVVTSSAIYSECGIKLLDEGMRIDNRLYERLLQHRLDTALDDQLTTQDAVDVRALEAQVQLLCGSTVLGRELVRFLGSKQHMLLDVLHHMKWPARASFKMTLMRHQLPELFEHSVLMMMTAVTLAVEEKLSLDDCAEIAAAALLHDIGMLYMPPKWVDPRYKLDTEERKQLAAHSITAMLVVRSMQTYSTRVEDAVLQHHERLDGTGYPRNAKGDEITYWGHILMLSEVISAFFHKFNDIPAQRLSLVLRMNRNRFDAKLCEHVNRFLNSVAAEMRAKGEAVAPADCNKTEVHHVIAALGAVFQYWGKSKRHFPANWQTGPSGRAGMYVDARLQALEKTLAESGSHPRQQADWLTMFEEDPQSMGEVVIINKEALWQVNSCVAACMRRWPQLLEPRSEFEAAMSDWLRNCRSVLGYGETEDAPVTDATASAEVAEAAAAEAAAVTAAAMAPEEGAVESLAAGVATSQPAA